MSPRCRKNSTSYSRRHTKSSIFCMTASCRVNTRNSHCVYGKRQTLRSLLYLRSARSVIHTSSGRNGMNLKMTRRRDRHRYYSLDIICCRERFRRLGIVRICFKIITAFYCSIKVIKLYRCLRPHPRAPDIADMHLEKCNQKIGVQNSSYGFGYYCRAS